MEQPEGFVVNGKDSFVGKLKHILYRLKVHDAGTVHWILT